jgi:hypothetical protein
MTASRRILDGAKKVVRPSTIETVVRNRDPPICDFLSKNVTAVTQRSKSFRILESSRHLLPNKKSLSGWSITVLARRNQHVGSGAHHGL